MKLLKKETIYSETNESFIANSNSYLKRKYNHSIINGVSNIYWLMNVSLWKKEYFYV